MRLVRTLVDAEDVDDVVAVLEERDIDYLLIREESGPDGRVLVEFPLPTQAVESVLEELRESDRTAEPYTVVVGTESVFSENVDEMEERFVVGTEEDDSIATEEIRATALDMTPSPKTYYSMTLLSAFVATAGLLIDSPAIVVGSMVIAPLIGSALTASLGTVLNDRTMIVEGFKTQVFGLLLAVAGATALSFALRSAAFLPPALDVTTTQQISQRISPGLLSLLVGLCAGAAGAFGLATGVSVMLVGVMVAAALIPAAAAVGVGIAWGIPAVAVGAGLLLVLNTVAIHVAAASVLRYLGYRPEKGPETTTEAPLRLQRLGPILATVLLLGAITIVTGGLVASHIAFEQQVNQGVGETLDEERYDDLELVTIQSEFGVPTETATDPKQVTVVVSRPVDEPYPALSLTIADRVEAETGRDVRIVVEFVERQRYPPDG